MARGLGRSKGCQNCLQRKIKCDEKTPCCTQCMRGGRQCSGALSTVFLIVDSDTVNTNPTYLPRIQKKSPEKSSNGDTNALARRRKRNNGSSRRTQDLKSCVAASRMKKLDLFSDVPCPDIFVNQLLSQLIAYRTRIAPLEALYSPWMHALPDMLAASSMPLRHSIIATSMVYVGRVSNNESMVLESYKWYGFAIERQRKLCLTLQNEKRLPTVGEICATVLLSIFEIICSTSVTGYFEHITGAVRLIEMRGPHECQSGIMQDLFRCMRVQLLYPCIQFRIPSIFATEEWLTIPFEGQKQSTFDSLISSISSITILNRSLDDTALMEDVSEMIIQRLILEERVTEIKDILDLQWESELRAASQIHGWTGDYFQGVRGFDFDYDCFSCEKTLDQDLSPELKVSLFKLTMRLMLLYNMARMLTVSLMRDLDMPTVGYYDQMQAHSDSILGTARYMTRFGADRVDSDQDDTISRLILPLLVVWRLSPLDTHRVSSREIITLGLTKGGARGICEVALISTQDSFRELDDTLYV